jgi:hypothetical protein
MGASTERATMAFMYAQAVSPKRIADALEKFSADELVKLAAAIPVHGRGGGERAD